MSLPKAKTTKRVKKVPWERFLKVERQAKGALWLASEHDPDLEKRIVILERQMQRLGAPRYREVKKGASKRG